MGGGGGLFSRNTYNNTPIIYMYFLSNAPEREGISYQQQQI